jgi:hypothetical protein
MRVNKLFHGLHLGIEALLPAPETLNGQRPGRLAKPRAQVCIPGKTGDCRGDSGRFAAWEQHSSIVIDD